MEYPETKRQRYNHKQHMDQVVHRCNQSLKKPLPISLKPVNLDPKERRPNNRNILESVLQSYKNLVVFILPD